MGDFILNTLTFPTVFYTGLLALVTLYWLSAIVGVFGVDSLDGDLNFDFEGDADLESGTFAIWLTRFKLDGIPLTITLSLIILTSWILSFLAVHFIFPNIPSGWASIASGFWILVLTPIISAQLISPLLQPLKPIFKKTAETHSADFVGQYATIRSGKVTATFGEAECNDGGAGLIIKVRSDEVNNIKRGDKVLLKRYDSQQHFYYI